MNLATIEGGDGVPIEPDWTAIYSDELDLAAAREKWGVVVRTLKAAQTLTVANGDSIQTLVELTIQYRRASRHVAEHGAILPAKRAKVGQHNPYWSVMTRAARDIQLLEKALCISPGTRSKGGKAPRKQSAPRPADAYLKARG